MGIMLGKGKKPGKRQRGALPGCVDQLRLSEHKTTKVFPGVGKKREGG